MLPAGVELTNNDNVKTAKGPKGNLLVSSQKILKLCGSTEVLFTVQTIQKNEKLSTELLCPF